MNRALVISLVAIIASAMPAEAAKKKLGVGAGGTELPMSTMAPLTASECERLGGTVNDIDTNCRGTGKSCTTKTLDNGTHTACITEVR